MNPGDERLRACRDRGQTARDMRVEGADLSSCDLTELRADNVKLDRVDLQDATLSRSQWTESTLLDVRLDRVVAHALIMRMCLLEGVRATAADLRGAKLENDQAMGIVLDRATLTKASLIDSDFTRASLRDADLCGVDATCAVLRGADLRGADLRDSVLVDADLRGADLRGAKLDGADLDGADLRGAILDDDESAEAPEAEPRPGPPPEVAELFAALAPTVVDLLGRGNRRGVLDEKVLAGVLDEMNKLGISKLDPGQSLLAEDGPMGGVLKRVGEVGVGPLLAALGNREPGRDVEPPPAVADLIRSLMGDAKLAPNATAEDLAVHLVRQVQSSLSLEGSKK